MRVFSKQKPWANGMGQVDAMWAFYDNEWAWKPTWDAEGDNLNMMVRWDEGNRCKQTDGRSRKWENGMGYCRDVTQVMV